MHTLPDDGFGTLAIHAGQEPEPRSGAIMTPIYQTSTFVQDGVARPRNGFEYARMTNPTRTALEANLAALEGGVAARAFGSGLAAAGIAGAANAIPLWQSAASVLIWPLLALALATAAFRKVTP